MTPIDWVRLRRTIAIVAALMLATSTTAATTEGGTSKAPSDPATGKTFVSKPVNAHKLDVDLRKLLREEPSGKREKGHEVPLGLLGGGSEPGAESAPNRAEKDGAFSASSLSAAEAAVHSAATPPEFSTANPNFPGIGYTQSVPPDTIGDVGPNHYIQMVNTSYAIYGKGGGAPLAGPTPINQLWINANAGGRCQAENRGDPVVVYDPLADRWLMSQFAFGADGGFGGTDNAQCIAISQGANPVTSGWFLYEFPMAFGHDYPKIGVWPDGYYMSSQQGFAGGALNAVVFDRASMLTGSPASFQARTAASPALMFLPGDLDGPPPPAGTPAFFGRHVDGALWGGIDRVEVWAFTTDWGNPLNTTFASVATLPVAPFSSDICAGTNLFNNCVPQPGTGVQLEVLPHWPMWRLQYRNFGTYEAMVFNHSVDVDGAGHVGIRWYELRRPPAGVWSVYQDGTFSPDDGAPGLGDDLHRWMGSIAMDKEGNMALGYSASSGTVNPEIDYTGRYSDDPLDLMPRGEFQLVGGQGQQILNGSRWGDYSSMNVDPVDDCTFWYTNEFMSNLGLVGAPPTGTAWATQIGAFRFPDCNQADLVISKSDTPDPVNAGDQLVYTVTVRNDGPDDAFGVVVTDTLPVGIDYVDDTGGCLVAANVLTCDLGDIGAGDSVTFQITVAVPSDFIVTTGPRFVTNTATVASAWDDPDDSNNTVQETTLVQDVADLAVTKLCKPDDHLLAGETGTCTIFVDNIGPSDARDVVLTDVSVSDGSFSITGAVPSQGSCSISAGTVTCDLGDLPAASTTESGRATVVITVTATEEMDINDTATVTSDTPDPDPTNNQATESLSVQAVSNLGLTKTDSPDPLAAGRTITYSLNVTNGGPSTARNVLVEDVVGAGQQIMSVSAPGGSCNVGVPGNAFLPTTCAFDSIAPAASKAMTIVVNVPDGILHQAQNDARVSSDVFDPDNSNDLASTTTDIDIADVEILKTSDFDVYKPSSTIKYTVVVTNHGPTDATNVVVTDNLPDVKQAIYQLDTGGCTKAGLVLTCALGTIGPMESKSFNVYVRIKGKKGEVTNTASVVTTSPDPGPAVNTSTRKILIKGGL